MKKVKNLTLGVMLLALLFVFNACDFEDSNNGSDDDLYISGSPTTLRVTDLWDDSWPSETYKTAWAYIVHPETRDDVAAAGNYQAIHPDYPTYFLLLINDSTQQWRSGGAYLVELQLLISSGQHGVAGEFPVYIYTGGKPLDELGIDMDSPKAEDINLIPKFNFIPGQENTIPFNHFKKVPDADWWDLRRE